MWVQDHIFDALSCRPCSSNAGPSRPMPWPAPNGWTIPSWRWWRQSARPWPRSVLARSRTPTATWRTCPPSPPSSTSRWSIGCSPASARAAPSSPATPIGPEQLATQALEQGTASGQPDATIVFQILYANASLQRGTVGDLVPLIEPAVAVNPEFTPVLAAAYVEGSRPDDARRLLDQFASDGYTLELNLAWLPQLGLYAYTAIELGASRHAAPLFEAVGPLRPPVDLHAGRRLRSGQRPPRGSGRPPRAPRRGGRPLRPGVCAEPTDGRHVQRGARELPLGPGGGAAPGARRSREGRELLAAAHSASVTLALRRRRPALRGGPREHGLSSGGPG